MVMERLAGWWVSPGGVFHDTLGYGHTMVIRRLVPRIREAFTEADANDVGKTIPILVMAIGLGWSHVTKFEGQLTVDPGRDMDVERILSALPQEHRFCRLLIVHPTDDRGYGPERMYAVAEDQDALDAWRARARPGPSEGLLPRQGFPSDTTAKRGD